VLSSPFLALKMKVPVAKELIGRAAGRLAPTLSLPSEIDIDHLTHDPDKLAERRVDTLCHEVASAGWFTAAIDAQEYVKELAHRVTVPTLWLVAGGDLVADPQAARTVHARLRAPSRMIELTDMYHEVFNEVDRGRVFGYLRTFLDERFSSQ
jgi:lysophospholipase